MNTINSGVTSSYSGLQYQYKDMTKAQKKQLYESMYDEAGNIKQNSAKWEHLRNNSAITLNLTSETPAGTMNGHCIERVGDDYVIFAMNPTAYFAGGKELTDEQLTYLQSSYDMENLSSGDRIKLLGELSCFGVISGNDAYAEAFPEKCSWMQNGDRQKFDIGSDNATDLSTWLDYYLHKITQAEASRDKLIASAGTNIAYFESERHSIAFYTKLSSVMAQITGK